MRAAMLGPAAALAGLLVLSSPASAQRWSDPGFVAAAAVSVHRGSDHAAKPVVGHDRRKGHRRHNRDRGPDIDYVTSFYGGEWARWNNRSWEPDSYNDWWHDRPDRSFPRWLQSNQDCARQWQGGGVWRC